MSHPVSFVDGKTELVEGVVGAENVHAQEGFEILVGINVKFGVILGKLLVVEHLVGIADVGSHAVQLLLGLLLRLGVHPVDLVEDVVEHVPDFGDHLESIVLGVLVEVLANVEGSHGNAKAGIRCDTI